jgi:hypothetical protein
VDLHGLELAGKTLAQAANASLIIRSRTTVFHAYENSEDDDRMDVLRALFDQPGLHSYPFVEIPFNTNLFHIDIAPVDDESRWQRFIFNKLENVFEFLAVERISEFRIYIQTRRKNGSDYQLKRIVEISQGYALSGDCAHVFLCENGSIEIDGFNELTERDICRMSSLWKESGIDV